jgi:voltage-gated potassium channel
MNKLLDELKSGQISTTANYSLFGLLLVQLFIIPIFPVAWHMLMFNVVATLVYFNLVMTINVNRKLIFILVLISVVMEWVFYFVGLKGLNQISFAFNLVLFMVVVVKFVILISQSKRVGINTILQSINGYLLFGVFCGMLINLIVTINPEAFVFPEAGILSGGVARFSEFQYFGLVTMSTLGYGEITPITPYARSAASFIAVVGQLYVAIIIALLVGKFSGQND